MPYDPSKDKTLKLYKPTYVDETDKITVGVYQYVNGQPKVGIGRYRGEQHVRLGRFTLREARYLSEALTSLLKSQKREAGNDKAPRRKSSKEASTHNRVRKGKARRGRKGEHRVRR